MTGGKALREFVNVWCRVLRIKGGAVQILDDSNRTHWLPISQMEYPEQIEKQGVVIPLSVARWCAHQKGLI